MVWPLPVAGGERGDGYAQQALAHLRQPYFADEVVEQRGEQRPVRRRRR